MTAVNGGAGIFIVRGRRHNDTVQAATKNVAENAQKIKISKPLPWKADDFTMKKKIEFTFEFICLEKKIDLETHTSQKNGSQC